MNERPPPFNLMRWAFVLLASILIVELLETVVAIGACAYMVLVGRSDVGACMTAGIIAQVREVLAEALTAILALLLAARDH
jgi:hypothetical protein